jgi:pseudouridine synthase
MVDGEKTKPALFKKIDDTTFSLTITEGRNRQIKKMVDALGYTVRELRRVRIEHIPLKNLPEGSYRPLTPEETSELLTRLGL